MIGRHAQLVRRIALVAIFALIVILGGIGGGLVAAGGTP